jgi:hypothetical protein
VPHERDAGFSHHPCHVGINLGGCDSCAFRFEFVSAQAVQESLCHLGTRGVVGAKKKNRFQDDTPLAVVGFSDLALLLAFFDGFVCRLPSSKFWTASFLLFFHAISI